MTDPEDHFHDSEVDIAGMQAARDTGNCSHPKL